MSEEEKPTPEELEKLAEETEEEAIDLGGIDMSLPDADNVTMRMAVELYQQLLNYRMASLSARANKAAGNKDEASKMQIQAIYAQNMAALIQKQYPKARKRMLEDLKEQESKNVK